MCASCLNTSKPWRDRNDGKSLEQSQKVLEIDIELEAFVITTICDSHQHEVYTVDCQDAME